MIKKITIISSLFVLIILFQNCSEFKSNSIGSNTDTASISNFKSINDNVISTSCASCHSGVSPDGGIDLSSYNAIIASGSVVPGDALASTFYTEVLSGDMPPGGDTIDSDYIEAIETWIDNGAIENEAPSVDAGNSINLVLPVTATGLAAAASDVDGTIVSYAWTQVSGPNTALFFNQNTAAPEVSGLILGSYVFSVTVTDDFGATASDIVDVVLTDAPNAAPSISLGADRIITLPTDTTIITANATDSDGSIVSYAWVQNAGPTSATLSGQATASLTASALAEGTYTFTATVTDDDGATANDSINVTVSPAAPTLSSLRTNVFNNKCAGCHLGGASFGGYNMDTYTGLINRVTPGNAAASVFFLEVDSNDMPPGNNNLTQAEKDDVEAWINAGALDN